MDETSAGFGPRQGPEPRGERWSKTPPPPAWPPPPAHPPSGHVAAVSTGPNPPAEPPEGERKGRGLLGFISDKAIPLLIAVLGLAAALAGTWGAVASADAQQLDQTNASLKRRNETLSEANSALSGEVETLTSERDRWKSEAEDPTTTTQPDADDGSTTGTTSPPPAGDSTVRRESGSTPITFSSGYSVDLESDAADWGVTDSSGGGSDLYFYQGSSGPQLSTGEVTIVDHVPTEAECDDATVLQPGLERDQTRVGAQMCMRTSDDRWAYIHVVAFDTDAETVTVDVIVWE